MGVNEHVEDAREGPMFSLTTGRYRYVKRYGVGKSTMNGVYISLKWIPMITITDHTAVKTVTEESSALSLRNNETALARLEDSAAGMNPSPNLKEKF